MEARKRNGENPEPWDVDISFGKIQLVSQSDTFFNNMALLVTDNNVF